MSVSGDTITGTLNALDDWLWDPFSFEHGTIGESPYHFIVLDFSENDYSDLESVTILYDDISYDLLADTDKIMVFEVKDSDDFMIITQELDGETLEQILDLSGLVLASE